MSNRLCKLASEIDAAIRPWLLTEGPLSQEEQERLSDLLWQLGEAAGDAARDAAEEAARPAPASAEALKELSRQLEWLSQEQSSTRRRIMELTEAIIHSDAARSDSCVKSFFTGFGLAAALTPAVAVGFYFLFQLVQRIARNADIPFPLLLSILVCMLLGIALFLGAGLLSGKLQRWLEKAAGGDDPDEEV